MKNVFWIHFFSVCLGINISTLSLFTFSSVYKDVPLYIQISPVIGMICCVIAIICKAQDINKKLNKKLKAG